MSNSYVDGKVREAIAAAKGSRAAAQKILMTMAAEDPDLLRGIAQPFLKAIAAAAIERAGRPASGGGARPSAGGSLGGGRSGGLSREALEGLLDRLGREPAGGSAAAGARPAGSQVRGAAAPAGQSAAGGGGTHEKSMMALAKAFAAKKVQR